MKNFLEKYNAFKIETSKDEGKLTLETAKERILKLLTDNIRNFKEDSWNLQNRMNKLIIDTEKNSIFTLRLGGKRIVRYSLDLLDTQQKISFLLVLRPASLMRTLPTFWPKRLIMPRCVKKKPMSAGKIRKKPNASKKPGKPVNEHYWQQKP